MSKASSWCKAVLRALIGGGSMTPRESGRQYAWDELHKGTDPEVLWAQAHGSRNTTDDFDRGIFDVLTYLPNPPQLTAFVRHADKEAERFRIRYDSACQTIAQMHAAAVGSTRGPRIGVVEDVAAMREELERIRVLYTELLYAVSEVHPKESRHESALRLLRDAQAFRNAQQGGHVNGF